MTTLEIALLTKNRESYLLVLEDLKKIRNKSQLIDINLVVYSSGGLAPKEINQEQIKFVRVDEDLNLDEKILEILNGSTSDYIWLVNDHSSIKDEIVKKLEGVLTSNTPYCFISPDPAAEALVEIHRRTPFYLPIFGTFINNNIFKTDLFRKNYAENYKDFNGSWIAFVYVAIGMLKNQKNVKLILSNAICYGKYKNYQYKNSWQEDINSYLDVSINFSRLLNKFWTLKDFSYTKKYLNKNKTKNTIKVIYKLANLSLMNDNKIDPIKLDYFLKSPLYNSALAHIFPYFINNYYGLSAFLIKIHRFIQKIK